MEANTGRDYLLEQLIRIWGEIPWIDRKCLAVAVKVNDRMKRISTMRKTIVGYVILASILMSFTGMLIFIVKNNALMSAAFGGVFAASLMFSAFYLVWKYLR